jgi:hypothetical protein
MLGRMWCLRYQPWKLPVRSRKQPNLHVVEGLSGVAAVDKDLDTPNSCRIGLKIHRAIGLSKVSNTAPLFVASVNPIRRPCAAAARLNQECRGEDVFGSISSIRFPKGSSTKILS